MKFKDKKLLKGALALTVGGFVTKIIGAVYRIPLTNILGAEGIGIYQMVFPIYCLLLTVSSTGVPSGISKLIAKGYNAQAVFKSAIKIFVPIGLVGSVLMGALSHKISVLQGNSHATLSYLLIAPSVLAVSVISAYRGFFQGFANMTPTATSQVIEQVVKMILGLTLCFVFKRNTPLAASLAALAVTFSELVTVFYLVLKKKKTALKSLGNLTASPKKVFTTVIPVMLSTIVMPITKTIESFFIINILNGYLLDATSRYGLYSGAVESLVGVPVSLLYGVAITSIPIIARQKAEGQNYIKKTFEVIGITALFSLICGVAFYSFSPFAVKILYSKLSVDNLALTINMAKIASLSVVFLPIMQTLSSVLIAMDKSYVPVLTASLSSIIKIIFTVIMLNIKKINIFAPLITDTICYIVACFFNLVYIIINNKSKKKQLTGNKLCIKY